MRVWRVSRHDGLDGEGGLLAPGRWHSRGRRVVYTADHPALAILEVLVHLEIDPAVPPNGYVLFEIDVPAALAIDDAAVPAASLGDPAVTRAIGDRWLAAMSGSVLRVPSAIAPKARNFLLNPAHADTAKIAVVGRTSDPFDPRLLRGA